MIPVECFSFQLFIRGVGGTIVSSLVTVILATASKTVAIQPTIGVASFMFHITSGWFAGMIVGAYDVKTALIISVGCWAVAWAVQLGIGHYLLEKNSPNVANLREVSYLAMCVSVLIAWSS